MKIECTTSELAELTNQNELQSLARALAESKAACSNSLDQFWKCQDEIGSLKLEKRVLEDKLQNALAGIPAHGIVTRQDLAHTLQDMLMEVKRGNKINAIKIYRELTNTGLKEAKDAIEIIMPPHR